MPLLTFPAEMPHNAFRGGEGGDVAGEEGGVQGVEGRVGGGRGVEREERWIMQLELKGFRKTLLTS